MFRIRRETPALTPRERTEAQINRARANGPVHPPPSREALAAIAESLGPSRSGMPGQWSGGYMAA